ncbi:MAG: hypothetical protein LW650_04505 [Planctomycetaceae bacterium]|jgi:hypothetical protein|nr:hypothetical protein [Phycisphaerales bacterium]MCE2652767.1 hypothetical protein [Planctomycetaceae bacterium]
MSVLRSTTVLCACLVFGIAVQAADQTVIYSNSGSHADAGLSSGPISASGIRAPAGWTWSEAQAISGTETNSIGGFSCQPVRQAGQPFSFADDFVVPAGLMFRVQTLSVFAYRPASGATSSPFDWGSVRLWHGVPGERGSMPLWGNLSVNRLVSAEPMHVYRIFASVGSPAATPNGLRPVWQINLSTGGLLLGPGTYWIEWQVGTADGTGEAFAPPLTLPGRRTRSGANSRQFRPASGGGMWADAIDPGKPAAAEDVPVDMPFLLWGSIELPIVCAADIVAIGGVQPPDGIVTGDDLIAFINAFAGSEQAADVVAVGGEQPPDGLVTGDDYIAFINAFASGCP